MKKMYFSSLTLIAVFGLALALLTFSNARAEGPSDTYQMDNVCTQDVLDTGTFDGSLLSSELPASDEAEPNACIFCLSNDDCPAGDAVCDRFKRCCVFF